MTEASTPEASAEQRDRPGDAGPRVVVRDKRRIDPESGEVRPEAAAAAAAPAGPAEPPVDEVAALRAGLEERTADLQRLKAEFDNYRRRVDRDRLAIAEQATAMALAQLVPVVDDVDRARAHGEVTGGFKVVADSLEAALARLGLTRFGAEGDPFDPTIHEAVMHSESPDVDGPTCVSVMRSGYRIGDRLVRPAMVAVAEPGSEPAGPADVPDEAADVMDHVDDVPDEAADVPDEAVPSEDDGRQS